MKLIEFMGKPLTYWENLQATVESHGLTGAYERIAELEEENEEWKTELGRVVVVIRLGLTDKLSLEKLDKHIIEKLESSGYFLAQESPEKQFANSISKRTDPLTDDEKRKALRSQEQEQ